MEEPPRSGMVHLGYIWMASFGGSTEDRQNGPEVPRARSLKEGVAQHVAGIGLKLLGPMPAIWTSFGQTWSSA